MPPSQPSSSHCIQIYTHKNRLGLYTLLWGLTLPLAWYPSISPCHHARQARPSNGRRHLLGVARPLHSLFPTAPSMRQGLEGSWTPISAPLLDYLLTINV